jgi:hypothetical protein
MRRIETTIVNVQVNDRTDRQNVVATLRTSLRCLRLFLREACPWLAKQCQHKQAMHAACAWSPSWGGYRSYGGPGSALSS